MNHKSVITAACEDPGHQLSHSRISYAYSLGNRLRRIGQRAEEIKGRRYAELTPHRSRMPQRRMVVRGEEKPDADLIHHVLLRRRGEIKHHPERLEDIRGTTCRGRCPVAVLDDSGTSGRRNDRRHSGDIDGVRAVPTATDNIDRGAADLDRSRELDHDI